MIIYSLPTATTPYRLDIPEIGRDYFMPESQILENQYIATSTAPAGFFRQIVKYDVTSVKRDYTVVLDPARAAILEAMHTSTQTNFYVPAANGLYEVNLIAKLTPFGKLDALAQISIAVVRKVS